MGAGYWVWLIPLGSGSTSVGIVADPALHPFHRLSRFDRAVDWLREFEPQCADVVEAHAAAARRFSRASAFRPRLRPRLLARSLGDDGGIGRLHRSVLFSRLRLHRDRQRLRHRSHHPRPARARTCASGPRASTPSHLRLFDAFLKLYDGQYPLMGNAQVMTAKVAWDNAAYWSVTALLFFQRRFRRPEFMASIDPLHAPVLRAARAHAAAVRRLGPRRRRVVRAFARQRDGRRSAAAAAGQSRRPDDGR